MKDTSSIQRAELVDMLDRSPALRNGLHRVVSVLEAGIRPTDEQIAEWSKELAEDIKAEGLTNFS